MMQGPQTISAAVFCPQNRPPQAAYLAKIRHRLLRTPSLSPLVETINKLQETWSLYAHTNSGILAMSHGPRYVECIQRWITNDESAPLTEIMSGIITLPVLTIIQIVQYFHYLEVRGIRHAELLEELSVGGTQGFCGGMLPVAAIASSANEKDLARNAAKSLRLALGIGAYAELGDEDDVPGPTTMVLRTKYQGQADELVSKFEGTYVSAVSDPTCVSIVGPVKTLAKLKAHAESQALKCTPLYIRGKVHNPENQDLSRELCTLCERTEELRLPHSATLRIPVRSNKTGEVLSDFPLSTVVVETALVLRCEWYTLMGEMTNALLSAERKDVTVAAFGAGRKQCVPSRLFEEKGLSVSIMDAESLAETDAKPTRDPSPVEFPDDAIAIVGAACRLPGASSLDELWDLISAGESKASEIPLDLFEPEKIMPKSREGRSGAKKLYGNFIDDVKSFDNSFFGISPREASYMDPQQRLLLETAYEALDSSGYLRHHQRESYDNVGCFLGSTYTEYLENTCGYAPAAHTATGTIRAFQSGKISYHFGWSGPSEVIDTACSSSLVAINRACKAIQTGECPMALAGGVNIITGIHNFLDLGKAGFLSPTGQCKPFDTAADGYCRADGVGLVVLKLLRRATLDGDDILGVIPAVSTNHGGLSPGITVPYSRAQVALFNSVLDKSGLRADQVSYIEAHGTGTQVGDPIEIGSIREVFGGAQRADDLHVGSIKANVGHSETAAGIGSLLKIVAMMQSEQIPPLAGFRSLNSGIPALEPDRMKLDSETVPWKSPLRAALVNSYGAAGSNSALICCQLPVQASHVKKNEDMIYPIVLSAATYKSLATFKTKLAHYLKRGVARGKVQIANVAFTLSERRQHHRVRWATTARTIQDLTQSLENDQEDELNMPKPPPKPVVLAFSGQSKQTIGLCRSWYDRFPRLRYHLDRCNGIVLSLGNQDLMPGLFQDEPLEDVVALHCGTFAVQYSCAMCWIDAGLDIAAVVGHSFGELTAMAVSGILSLEDTLRLICARAAFMKTEWPSERGVMLAVLAAKDTVHEILNTANAAGLQRPVEVACFNGPSSQVLVGTLSDIQKTEDVLSNNASFQDVKHQRLDVTHGFHSVFTEPILGPLSAFANKLHFGDAKIPLESCTESPLGSVTAERVAQHTRRPVFFQDAIARLEDRLGPCIWLEAGLGSPIVNMVKKTVSDPREHVFLPLKAVSTTDVVAKISTALWREGLSPAFWEFASPKDSGLRQVWLPPYQFLKTPHWLSYNNSESSNNVSGNGSQQLPPKLVSLLDMPSNASSSEFTVHTDTPRFREIVCGHAVRGQPLCPASMYMECVVMGIQIVAPTYPLGCLKFESLHFQSGLGISPDRDTSMQLAVGNGSSSWDFSFWSNSKVNPKSRPTLHSKGSFKFTQEVDFDLHERLMWDQVETIANSPRAEHLKSGRAYTLFSRVVQYAECLRGISSIAMLDSEAVAEVKHPAKLVSSSETTAAQCCDTVALDTFIQVVGLLINSSDSCPDHEVFIASHIESVILQDCSFGNSDVHKVYAKTRQRNASQVVGDLLVFTKHGKLVVALTGVQFTRLPIAKLEGMLEHLSINADARRTNDPATLGERDSYDGTQSSASSVPKHTPESESDFDEEAQTLAPPEAVRHDNATSVDLRKQILDLIAENCGGPVDNMEGHESLEDLGIDSLSVVELRDALESAFNLQLSKDNPLLESTVDEVCTYISTQRRI